MKVILQTNKCLVVDEFLPEALHAEVWRALAYHTWNPGSIVGNWSRTWDVDGPLPYSTDAILHSKAKKDKPTVNSAVGDHMAFVAGKAKEWGIEGLIKPWDDLRLHSQMMLRGTKLYCHPDKHSCGSFTWYAHQVWRSHWGGELFLPDVPLYSNAGGLENFQFGRDWEDKHLANGTGTYVAPMPNRMILVAPGAYHGVNRVDVDAGDALRVVVVGFLIKNEPAVPKA